VIFVDSKNQVIKKEFIFEGTINYSIIEPRKIIKRALVLDASGFFIIHNHPSGDVTPSEDDINVTKKIKKVCENLNLRFLDHLIYGDNDFFSFFDNDIF
jgi:DNA repair protein RadC